MNSVAYVADRAPKHAQSEQIAGICATCSLLALARTDGAPLQSHEA